MGLLIRGFESHPLRHSAYLEPSSSPQLPAFGAIRVPDDAGKVAAADRQGSPVGFSKASQPSDNAATRPREDGARTSVHRPGQVRASCATLEHVARMDLPENQGVDSSILSWATM